MPIYQEIIEDIKQQEISEDAKDVIYRNCLVCGDNNYACGWFLMAKKILTHF
jgi:phosphoribosyl-dephospho-CoA transferase